MLAARSSRDCPPSNTDVSVMHMPNAGNSSPKPANSPPELSIVIPIGPGRTGKRALASLIDAGLRPNDEVIVILDGHAAIATPILPCLVRTFSWQRPRGAAAARNQGLRMASSDVVCFLDDDDRYTRGALQKLREAIDTRGPTIAWCLAWRAISGRRQHFIPRGSWIRERDLLHRNVAGGGSTLVVRRRIFQDLGGFDELLVTMEDWDAWLRLARTGPIRRIPGPLVEYDDIGDCRLSGAFRKRIDGLSRLLAKHHSTFPPRVRRFHEARLCVEEFMNGQRSVWRLMICSAPLATLMFLARWLYSTAILRRTR